MGLCSFFLTTVSLFLSAISSSHSSTFQTCTASALVSRAWCIKTSHHFMIRRAERYIVRPCSFTESTWLMCLKWTCACVSLSCKAYNEVNTNSWPLPSTLGPGRLWNPRLSAVFTYPQFIFNRAYLRYRETQMLTQTWCIPSMRGKKKL